jgi:hypothetical protein
MPAAVHRGKLHLRHGLVLAAIFTGPIWIAGTVAALIRSYRAGMFMVIAVALALVAASQLFPERPHGIVVCAVPAALAAIFAFIWMPLAVLDLRGEPVTAVVTAEHVVRGKHNVYRYELRGLDGRVIAGSLTEYDDVYEPGDDVAVIVDRRQQLDPRAAAELDGERETGIAAAGLLVLTTALSIGVGSRGGMAQVDLRIRSRYRPRH